ncbi:MAG: hypothetical protein KIS74_06990 [Burkholderiales bacterium]|nr:hypothetical protein [Burkholderiales bacterium]
MDAIRIDRAQPTLPAEFQAVSTPPNERQVAAIRSLDDWELALASGGEGGYEWP